MTNSPGLHPLRPSSHPNSSTGASFFFSIQKEKLPFQSFIRNEHDTLSLIPRTRDCNWEQDLTVLKIQPYRSGTSKDLGQLLASASQSLTPVAAMSSTAKEVIKQTKARIKGIISPLTHTQGCVQLSEGSSFPGPWGTLPTPGHRVSSLLQ